MIFFVNCGIPRV